jgi:FkbM family methyltransferase
MEVKTFEYNGRKMSFDQYGEDIFVGGEGPIMSKNFDIKPGEVFFDVGAGDSSWTIYALASGAAAVYAFEPSIPNYKKLVMDVLLNDGFFERSKLLNVGLDREDCVRTLAESYARQGGYDGLDISPDCTVPTRFLPLDHFLPELTRLDWIKMDIEGGEYDAMLGGAKTIAKFKPNFIIENHENVPRMGEWMRGNKIVEKMRDLFQRFGYREVYEDSHPNTYSRSYIVALR